MIILKIATFHFLNKVGHTFLLGTKYSEVLNAKFSSVDGSRSVCQMGCYGIGISRILAASVEVLSTETEIRWPSSIAPYSVCVLAPKVEVTKQIFFNSLKNFLFEISGR